MEAERGGVTPFWVETNQDFRRHRRHNRRNIRVPDGVFAFFLSPLALIPTLLVVAVLLSYIPTFLSPLSQFLRRVLLFKSWEAFNLLLVLFAILTGIFSRNTDAGGHHLHHQEGEPFAANFDFPGKSEDRNGHDEVGGSRIIFHRSDPLRNEETYPAAVEEEAPVSLDLKAEWFPDDGRKTKRFGSEGNLISPDAHFQRDADFGKRNMRSPCSSSADSPPKTSNVDRGSLIQTWRSPSSLHHPPPPLENIDAEDGFVVPRRRSPPPRLPPLGIVNVEGGSNIRSKHFPPPLLSHPPETINADDGADVLRKHSRPLYHPLETMNSDDGCVIQTKHSPPPLKSLSQPALPHSAHSHALEAPESKTKRRSGHRSKDASSGQGGASSPPLAPSSSSKKEKKKKEKENRKEKKKSRGTEPTAEIPVPPSLPQPPPSSFFHQWFAELKNETKLEKLGPHSDRILPPLPPSSLPLHLGTTREASSSIKKREIAGKENVGSRDSSSPRPFLPLLIKEKQKLQIEVRSSSSDSSSGRSIPYLPPPPPPPFAVAEENKVKGSKYVQTRRESRRVYEGPSERSRGEERSGNSLFCPSPDVNVKADKFIARFHEGIRLEKLQSAKQKLVREGTGAKG